MDNLNPDVVIASLATDPGILLILILLVAAIFGYLYFRRKPRSRDETALQQVELKLKGEFSPSEVRVRINQPVQMLIHRFDTEPADEIFEIEELQLHELLPAGHTTVIAFFPEQKGTFRMLLDGDREAGILVVE